MSDEKKPAISRRTFVRRTGLTAGGMLMGTKTATSAEADAPCRAADKQLPRRKFGKTNESVTSLAMGLTPSGFSRHVSARQIAALVNTAIDSGIAYIDTARRYGNAEEGVGLGLGSRRKEVFLTSKVFADTIPEAEESLSTSLKNLKTDHLDLVYLHNVGKRDMSRALEPDGIFPWLVKQKKAGKFRFLGISGHNLPDRFPRFIKTGEVDVLMCTLNPVDRYTYNFEQKVLPLAREYKLGIVAMKVFGGIRAGADLAALSGPQSPPLLNEEYLELALRYALGLPGVAVANIGVYYASEIRKNVEMVKNYRPLSPEEDAKLAKLGRQLAAKWGPHLGPASESDA